MTRRDGELDFDEARGNRPSVFLASAVVTWVTGTMCWIIVIGPNGARGLSNVWLRIAIDELILTFFLLALTTLVWSIAAPKRLENYIRKTGNRLMLLFVVGVVAAVVAGALNPFLGK